LVGLFRFFLIWFNIIYTDFIGSVPLGWLVRLLAGWLMLFGVGVSLFYT
jgi:hypothetical protein